MSERPPESEPEDPDATATADISAAPALDTDAAAIANAHEMPERYRTLGEHARGGIGRILMVQDTLMSRSVALKELLDPHFAQAATAAPGSASSEGPARTARFLREARITGQLEHPSIVPVYELGTRQDGRPYYTMKFVRGRTLARVLKETITLEERLRLLPHFLGLCQAIAYAHSRGVIHRDIKPANVMVGEFGETVVIDWGLAKTAGKPDLTEARDGGPPEEISADHALTREGVYVGTPQYMAPEQAQGDWANVAEPSDVYALGAVLYEILTGRRPFTGESAERIINKVLTQDPVPVRELVPGVPPELSAICARAMQRAPEARYGSAKELVDDVQRFMSGALVEAHEYQFSEHLLRFVRRHKAAVATASVFLLTLIVTGVWSYLRIAEAQRSEYRQRVAAQNANRSLIWENYTSALALAQGHIEDGAYLQARKVLEACPEEHRSWEWGRLRRQAGPEILAIPHMPSAPESLPGRILLQFSRRDGTLWAVSAAMGVRALDFETGRWRSVRGTGGDWPDCTRFCSERNEFSLSLDSGSVAILDVPSREAMETFRVHTGTIESFAFSADGRWAAGYAVDYQTSERRILIWERGSSGQPRPHEMPPIPKVDLERASPDTARTGLPRNRVLGILPGGKLVFADGVLGMLDVQTGARHKLCACDAGLAALAASAQRAVAGSRAGVFEVWDLVTARKVSELAHSKSTEDPVPAISPDGKVAAVTSGAVVRLWRAETGQPMGVLRSHSRPVLGIAFGHGSRCVASTDDREVKVWPVYEERDSERRPFIDSGGLALNAGPVELCWSSSTNGTLLVTASREGGVSAWEVPLFRHRWFRAAEAGPPTCLALAPDGDLLAIADSQGSVSMWDAQRGEPLPSLAEPMNGFKAAALCFSPDGSMLGAAGSAHANADGGEVRFAGMGEEPAVHRVSLNALRVHSLSFGTHGDHAFAAASGQETGTGYAVVVDVRTFEKPPLRIELPHLPAAVVPVPQTSHILVLGQGGGLALWEPASSQEIWNLPDMQAAAVLPHPDGERFVSIDTDHVVTVRAMRDGRELITLGRGRQPAGFFPDGRRFFCLDESVRKPDAVRPAIIYKAGDWTIADEGLRRQDALSNVRRLLGAEAHELGAFAAR